MARKTGESSSTGEEKSASSQDLSQLQPEMQLWPPQAAAPAEVPPYSQQPEPHSTVGAPPPDYHQVNDHTPASTPIIPCGPPTLHILAATWGGVVVTDDVLRLVAPDHASAMIHLPSLHKHLLPDPCPGTVKTLAILYYVDGHEGPSLLLVTENHPQRDFVLNSAVHQLPVDNKDGQQKDQHPQPQFMLPATYRLPPRFSTGSHAFGLRFTGNPSVDIVAVTYGPRRIDDPVVLQKLAVWLETTRSGQIRMTNDFFGQDPAPGTRKGWSIFFRFGHSGQMQVVTGLEGGALEEPWTRY